MLVDPLWSFWLMTCWLWELAQWRRFESIEFAVWWGDRLHNRFKKACWADCATSLWSPDKPGFEDFEYSMSGSYCVRNRASETCWCGKYRSPNDA